MKPLRLSIILLAALLLAGCAPKPDPRIAQLEARVALLEARMKGADDYQLSELTRLTSQFIQFTNRIYLYPASAMKPGP